MYSGIFWRVLIAVIAVVLFNALLAPVSHVLGFPIGGDLLLIVRICVAAIAIFYIIKGPPPF